MAQVSLASYEGQLLEAMREALTELVRDRVFDGINIYNNSIAMHTSSGSVYLISIGMAEGNKTND